MTYLQEQENDEREIEAERKTGDGGETGQLSQQSQRQSDAEGR